MLPGISNAAVTSQANQITETLSNTTTSPIIVTYLITPTANGCTDSAFNYMVTVNPTTTVTSAVADTVCNSTAQNYSITSDVSGTTFVWSRAVVAGISNAAVVNQSNSITETLNNTSNSPVDVTYIITPTANGCAGPASNYVVHVGVMTTPMVSSNSPLCNGDDLSLTIPLVPGGSYSWTGPNGFNSTEQNPVIANGSFVNAGVYQLTVMKNGCTSTPGSVNVVVNDIPLTPQVTNNGPL